MKKLIQNLFKVSEKGNVEKSLLFQKAQKMQKGDITFWYRLDENGKEDKEDALAYSRDRKDWHNYDPIGRPKFFGGRPSERL